MADGGIDFRDVDASGNAAGAAAYLDAMSANSMIAAAKRRRDELMGLRSGDALLEVGCGTGEDVRAAVATVGANGRAVGLDSSEELIAEAHQRTTPDDGPVEFLVGDAHALPFGDNEFDAARVERVLQHVADPQRAIAELVRVVRPGGTVVICEPDWGTIAVDAADAELARLLERAVSGAVQTGWIGRQLRRRVLDAGCEQVTMIPETLLIDQIAGFGYVGDLAALLQAVPQLEALITDLTERAERGRLFAAMTLFTAVATVP